MSDKVLMELTEAHLETGLRGVPVGYCTTSSVDPEKGLHYINRPIGELADKDPEEVIFLLLDKRFPDEEELRRFKKELLANASVPEAVIDSMRVLPKDGHPMKWLVHGLNTLGMSCSGDYSKDALHLIAKIPTIVAAIYRIRSGWGDPIEPNPELGYMENFVHMLGVPDISDEDKKRLTHLMRVFDVLHFDNGGGNLSAFTGKAVDSGLADLDESIIGAMCSLAGPHHGKANQECLKFIEECIDSVGGEVSEDTVQSMVRNRLKNKKLIFGFGHAVLRVEDPRATVFCALSDQICPDDKNFHMVQALRKVVPDILKENPKISCPYPNVDLGSGTLLHACGLQDPDYYTVLFGMSRIVGIAIQILYERNAARGGKGLPIIRPKYLYSEKGSA